MSSAEWNKEAMLFKTHGQPLLYTCSAPSTLRRCEILRSEGHDQKPHLSHTEALDDGQIRSSLQTT
ncbi:MAG: hypothetical protein ACKOW3_02750 [Hyphomicrobium sp.]